MPEPFSSNVFGIEAAHAYAEAAKVSRGYVASILGIGEAMVPMMRNLQQSSRSIHILEVGGGQGKSGYALVKLLTSLHLTQFNLTSSEPDTGQINEGRRKIETEEDTNLIVPTVQCLAEDLSIFPDGSFDIIFGSQVIHWIPGAKIPDHLQEAHRVLKPGGRLIHATSGLIDLGALNKNHFTHHPFVLNNYLPAFEQELMDRGYWKKEWGKFVPWNPLVNHFYHNFTLARIQELLDIYGFDISTVIQVMCPLDTKEMELRLTNLAMLNMHLFAGKFGSNIPKEEKIDMANLAFNKALEKAPDEFNSFDQQPTDIVIGSIPEKSSGEPVPVIVADKN